MTRYAVSTFTGIQKVGNEMVILDLNTGHYYGLNDVGCRMLELVQELGELDAVLDSLACEYDADANTLSADLTALLADLEHYGLVHKQA